MRLLLVVQLLASAAMFGLIFCIQLVHYPMFAQLNPEVACSSIAEHGRRITWFVGPCMLLELMCALGCCWLYPGPLADLGLGCVALLWLSTALLSVPCHNRLVREYSQSVVNRLVQTNWIRTVLWSLRTAFSAWFLLFAA